MKLENSNPNSLFYFLNITQLTFLKFYLNLLDSKEVTKEQISKTFTLFNYFCFWLSILPFLWFICKLPTSTNRTTLATNLPGLAPVSNEMFWESLLYPFDYNYKLSNSVKEIDANSNAFLLNHEKLNDNVQTLLNFTSSSHKSYLKEFKPRSIDNKTENFLSYDLDEIPTKLESTFTKRDNELVFLNTQKIREQLNKKLLNKSSVTTSKAAFGKKQTSEEQNLKIAVSKEKTKLKLLRSPVTNSNFNPSFEKTVIKSKDIQNWSNFCQANEIFAKYSRNAFFQSLFANENVTFLQESAYARPRFMSGYLYPDMNSQNVWRLRFSEAINSAEKNLTISYYPKSIYFPSNSSVLSTNEIKQLSSPIYEIGVTPTESGVTMFLRHDSKLQDLVIKDRLATQTSFLIQGVKNNLETTKPSYFFANLNKSDLDKLVKERELNFEMSEKHSTNLNHPLIQLTNFFSVTDPSLNLEEIKNSYYQGSINPTSNLISISDFRSNQAYLIPNTHSNQNSKSFLLFFANNTGPINLLVNKTGGNNETRQINLADTLINTQNSFFEYSPNLYKREIGSYWKTKTTQTEEFVTLNEAINLNSIFSASLIGFLIATFLILKTAYADYAKEFSSYLLDLISSGKALTLDPSTIEWLNQELGLEEKKGGIRVFPKNFSRKRFTDIAGIKKLLPELSELVWFLRNKGRSFHISPLTSKSVLLVGPPGTGKTLLVQALAAEAEVPVVAQSTSVLAGMNQDLSPGDAIRMAFQKARALAPCILFLDELDSLGLKRDSLLTNNSSSSLGFSVEDIKAVPFFQKSSSSSLETTENNESSVEGSGDYLTNQLRINITNEFNSRKQQEREQVAALTQLLIEIDGVQTNSGILVIGATNRSNLLDPALIRPGRFSKVISLPLPDKTKRIEIFKLHSRQLGWQTNINWDYLAQRTKGFSAGDLSTVANQSAIQAILENSKHTLETFENAITSLTTYPTERPKALDSQDPYYLQRQVYYKVAQTFYNYSQNVDGKACFVELTSRQSNPRHSQILANLNNDKNRLRTRYELENLLTSLISGKVGELLMLLTVDQKTSLYWESDLAKTDFYEATKLVVTMMQDWYLYSSFFQQQKFLTIPTNQNEFEYRKNEEVYSLFEETVSYLEQQLSTQFHFSFSQTTVQKAQWKANVSQEISNVDSLFAEWSRFHLPDPQETDRNPEWIPPEEYYSDNSTKKYFSADQLLDGKNLFSNLDDPITALSFSELALIERDRYTQTILLSGFNKAFLVLEKNREVLDTLAYFLLKNKILRDFEIASLLKQNILKD